MLSERYSEQDLVDLLQIRSAPSPMPAGADRTAWEALLEQPHNKVRKGYVLEQAQKVLQTPWPQLFATDFMAFQRTGCRTAYETGMFERRRRIAVLALAECMEHEGRFLDELTNGLWLISEEATWSSPAHCHRLASSDALPGQEGEALDLFATETAWSLAEAEYLLSEELASISRNIRVRIHREIDRRILTPFESKAEGSDWLDGHNNWTPWCCSNVLGAALHVITDPHRLARMTAKLNRGVDRFIAGYSDEGGCDEGPMYWNKAAGAMGAHLELLHHCSDGRISIFDQPKIRAMGEYPVHVYLDGGCFASFADSLPRVKVERGTACRLAERTGSDDLRHLAVLGARSFDPRGPIEPPLGFGGCAGQITSALRELFWMSMDPPANDRPRPLTSYLPDIQVLNARTHSTPDKGFVLCAKGGHNDESHNHNDIGQFILLHDGRPIIVDAGAATYTRQVFSAERYNIWWTRGLGHNPPVVNGAEQMPGSEYQARDVVLADEPERLAYSMQLAQAYPAEAKIASLTRTFRLDRSRPALEVSDELTTTEAGATFELRLLTPCRCRIDGNRVAFANTQVALDVLTPSPAILVEEVDLQSDARMSSSWPDGLRRIVIRTRFAEREGACRLTFCLENNA